MADKRTRDGTDCESPLNINASKTQNKFSNDGSFLEMFKKKMEEERKKTEDSTQHSSSSTHDQNSHSVTVGLNDKKDDAAVPKPKKTLPFVGKRRGAAPVLKTGVVKKKKSEDKAEKGEVKKNAWAQYMDEVQKYKSQACQDEDKTRPLVK
ncbi:telomerase RNA component interacting RNase [Lingula anatina]|uniref:Telomerase RNA component interacting RNase n=1 Tax=Lingula anatina TaxID=7574 RepID=A0A1S3HY67_LINAN|nr:telomerase RNA component interacting RNase [Lingula anatina]|eukprot:XP_013390019.1 telomerase RNA component interacting RNase [Lingula anatina]